VQRRTGLCPGRRTSRAGWRAYGRGPADGPEGMTVAEMDALLYLPGHTRNRNRSAPCASRP